MRRVQAIVTRAGKLLLAVNQLGGSTWQCLPGGAVRPGEEEAQAILRILREECGVEGRVLQQTAQAQAPFAGESSVTFHVDIGEQTPTATLQIGHGTDADITAVIWRDLTEISERDRAFLWSAGLMAIPVFAEELASWSADVSYPRHAPAVVQRPELGCGGRTVARGGLTVGPLEEVTAKMIAAWQYEPPYQLYSFQDHPQTLQELLYGNYYGVTQAGRGLIGYFCYGEAAQVPAGLLAGMYQADCLDMGLGLRPDLCGKGEGLGFVRAGMAYARGLTSRPLRLTVAAFNQRAIRVYERAGFATQGSFDREGPGQQCLSFRVMTAPADGEA